MQIYLLRVLLWETSIQKRRRAYKVRTSPIQKSCTKHFSRPHLYVAAANAWKEDGNDAYVYYPEEAECEMRRFDVWKSYLTTEQPQIVSVKLNVMTNKIGRAHV